MFGFDTIMLVIISAIMFIPAQFLSRKFKIAPPIFYLIIGVLFGVGGLAHLSNSFYILGNVNYFPHSSSYNTFALYLMFMGAGFSISLKKNKGKKKQKGSVSKLSTVPVYFEAITLFVFLNVLFYAVPSINMGLNIYEIALICAIISMASPANVIPITSSHIQEGRTGRNNIANDMILASVLDNSTPMPYLLPIMIVVLGSALNISLNPVLLVILALMAMGVFLIIGAVAGFVAGKLFLPLAEKYENNNKKLIFVALAMYVVLVICIATLSQINAVKSMMGLFGIFVAMISGAGINTLANQQTAQKIRLQLNKLFAIFGTPIVFISVGSQINLTVFKDFKLIMLILCIIAFSVILKSLATKYVLKKDDGYLQGDINYAISCFIPKGITLVNFSVVLKPMLSNTNSNLIPTMILIASITILITIPLGVTLMSTKGKAWLS